MKKIYVAILIALIAIPTIGVQAEEKEYRSGVVKQGRLEIDVWVDNEDEIYYEGESITVLFHANRDCFVAIYSLDTRGNVNLLYPANPWDNGFVYGGEVYAVPADVDEYELIVTGPEGIEHIQAIASTEEMDIPDWYDGSPLRSDYYDESEDFLDHINSRYFGTRWEDRGRAFDRTSIYVKTARYYYKPVYVPHHWYDYPHHSMIYIDYPYGAEIYIDGIYFGIAPMWIPRVMVGWHWFTIYDRYGYCWEDHINVIHNNTIRLDRSRVKTSRSVISRFKDVRTQPKKYSRSNYVLSDKKVTRKTVTKKDITSKTRTFDNRTKKTTRTTNTDRYTKKKSGTSKPNRIEDSWNSKKPTKSKVERSGKTGSGTKKKSTPEYRKGTTGSKKSGSGYKTSGTRKSSGSSGKSESSYKSTPKPKSSSGKSGKSGSSYKSTPKPKKSSGSKSSSSKGKGGSVSKSSGSSKSSSVGRTSSGRSTSGKSSSGKSSSKGGGKRN